MIYLCSVYSCNGDVDLMQKRYEYAAKRTAEFMKEGHTIFCPINHCHMISKKHNMPTDWEFWKRHDLDYISNSDELWVLTMPFYKDSVGITAEIAFAKRHNIPIKYIPCDDYSEESEDVK